MLGFNGRRFKNLLTSAYLYNIKKHILGWLEENPNKLFDQPNMNFIQEKKKIIINFKEDSL